MGATYGGKKCCDPKRIRNDCREQELPTNWYGQPNKFMTAMGAWPGRGWVLMTREDINNLDRESPQDLIFTVEDLTITIKDLIYVRATCIVPSALGDPRSVYLVDLRDARHLAQNDKFANYVNKHYNVRAPAGGSSTYYQDSLNPDVEPWDWQSMLDDLWMAINVPLLAASSPQLPFTPQGTPENFRFPGVSAWQAYNEVLYRLGCAFVLDHRTSQSGAIVQIGAANADYEQAQTTYFPERNLDYDPIESDIGKIPASVNVAFHKIAQDYGTESTTGAGNQWSMDQVYIKNAPNPDAAGTSSYAGSSALIWDDLPAVINALDGTIVNQADLDARATERANDYYRMLTASTLFHQRFAGIIDDPGFQPNSLVTGMAWYDVGKGYFTELVRKPPPLRPDEDGDWQDMTDQANEWLKAPDLGRATTPNYPDYDQVVRINDTTQEANVYDAVVETYNPATLVPLTRETCWVYLLNGASVDPGSETLARINGSHLSTPNAGDSEMRPLYIADAAGGGGGGVDVQILRVNTDGAVELGFYDASVVTFPSGAPIALAWLYSPNGQVLDATHYYLARLYGVITLVDEEDVSSTRPLYVLADNDTSLLEINSGPDSFGIYDATVQSLHLGDPELHPDDQVWLRSYETFLYQPGDLVAGIPNGFLDPGGGRGERPLYSALPKGNGSGTTFIPIDSCTIYWTNGRHQANWIGLQVDGNYSDIYNPFQCNTDGCTASVQTFASVANGLYTGADSLQFDPCDFLLGDPTDGLCPGTANVGVQTAGSTTRLTGLLLGADCKTYQLDICARHGLVKGMSLSVGPPATCFMITIIIINIIDAPPGYGIRILPSCTIYWIGTINPSLQTVDYTANWTGFIVNGNYSGASLETSPCSNVALCHYSVQLFTSQSSLYTGVDTLEFDPCDFLLNFLEAGRCPGLAKIGVQTFGKTIDVTISYLDPSCNAHTLRICVRDGLIKDLIAG
jgi:hypothetical protein